MWKKMSTLKRHGAVNPPSVSPLCRRSLPPGLPISCYRCFYRHSSDWDSETSLAWLRSGFKLCALFRQLPRRRRYIPRDVEVEYVYGCVQSVGACDEKRKSRALKEPDLHYCFWIYKGLCCSPWWKLPLGICLWVGGGRLIAGFAYCDSASTRFIFAV